MTKYKGWSYRGRPFSKAQYKESFLKKNTGMSYARYLREYARQIRNTKKKSL